MSFNVGDVVVLKSGGPLMTIVSVDGNNYYVTWFNCVDGSVWERKTAEFVGDALERSTY